MSRSESTEDPSPRAAWRIEHLGLPRAENHMAGRRTRQAIAPHRALASELPGDRVGLVHRVLHPPGRDAIAHRVRGHPGGAERLDEVVDDLAG